MWFNFWTSEVEDCLLELDCVHGREIRVKQRSKITGLLAITVHDIIILLASPGWFRIFNFFSNCSLYLGVIESISYSSLALLTFYSFSFPSHWHCFSWRLSWPFPRLWHLVELVFSSVSYNYKPLRSQFSQIFHLINLCLC